MDDEHRTTTEHGPQAGAEHGPADEAGPDGAAGAEHESGAGAGSGPGARGPRARINEGFQRGVGAFTALKDALEETWAEARERGDLSTDRAREALGRAVDRAREATSDARDRFDFVPKPQFDALLRRVERLERHLGLADEPAAAETAEEEPSA